MLGLYPSYSSYQVRVGNQSQSSIICLWCTKEHSCLPTHLDWHKTSWTEQCKVSIAIACPWEVEVCQQQRGCPPQTWSISSNPRMRTPTQQCTKAWKCTPKVKGYSRGFAPFHYLSSEDSEVSGDLNTQSANYCYKSVCTAIILIAVLLDDVCFPFLFSCFI